MFSFYEFLLWFQVFYSMWQFVRDAKFFKLPYLFVISLLRFRVSSFLPFEREIYLFKPFIDCSDEDEVISDDEAPPKDDWYLNTGRILYTNKTKIPKVSFLIEMLTNGKIVAEPKTDLLLPGLTLVKCCTPESIITYIDDFEVVRTKMRCFVGFSSGNELNKNFLRMISIWPLVLQAMDKELLSAILSGLVILCDIFTSPCNTMWQNVKLFVFKWTKLLISNLKSVDDRENLHTFLSTISSGFHYCDVIRKMSYNKDIRFCIVSQFYHCEVNDEFRLSKISDMDFPEMRGFCEVKYEYLGQIIRVTPEGEPKEGVQLMTMCVNDVEYLSQEMSLSSFNKMNKLFKFVEENKNSIIVEKIKGKTAHLPSPKQLFYQIDFFSVCLRFETELKVFISASEIMGGKRSLPILSRNKDKLRLTSMLLMHNERFFQRRNELWLVDKLLRLRTCKWNSSHIKNCEWKKYLSDFSLILMSFGEPRLKCCNLMNPSKTLVEIINVKPRGVTFEYNELYPERGAIGLNQKNAELKEYIALTCNKDAILREIQGSKDGGKLLKKELGKTIGRIKLIESQNEGITEASVKYRNVLEKIEMNKNKKRENRFNGFTLNGRMINNTELFRSIEGSSTEIETREISLKLIEKVGHTLEGMLEKSSEVISEGEAECLVMQEEIVRLNEKMDKEGEENFRITTSLDLNYTKTKAKLMSRIRNMDELNKNNFDFSEIVVEGIDEFWAYYMGKRMITYINKGIKESRAEIREGKERRCLVQMERNIKRKDMLDQTFIEQSKKNIMEIDKKLRNKRNEVSYLKVGLRNGAGCILGKVEQSWDPKNRIFKIISNKALEFSGGNMLSEPRYKKILEFEGVLVKSGLEKSNSGVDSGKLKIVEKIKSIGSDLKTRFAVNISKYLKKGELTKFVRKNVSVEGGKSKKKKGRGRVRAIKDDDLVMVENITFPPWDRIDRFHCKESERPWRGRRRGGNANRNHSIEIMGEFLRRMKEGNKRLELRARELFEKSL